MRTSNYLSIDVEDYFQVSAFESVSPPETWGARQTRVERNVDLVLALLAEQEVKGTFFVLGWVAQRFPQLVKKIVAQGHELASHGYGHRRIDTLQREAFRADIRRTKEHLEDLSGVEVLGYRAPSYSISRKTPWAFDELFEAGYRYDSSIFPIKHDFYGMSDWPSAPGFAAKASDGSWQPAEAFDPERPCLRELPIAPLNLCGNKIPIAGGGYFRLFPYSLTRWGLKRINSEHKQPFVFYLHPWEFDPQQPRMANIPLKSRVRHYLNLNKTEHRFKRLLNDFRFCPLRKALEDPVSRAD